jgi:hypothetical protein
MPINTRQEKARLAEAMRAEFEMGMISLAVSSRQSSPYGDKPGQAPK